MPHTLLDMGTHNHIEYTQPTHTQPHTPHTKHLSQLLITLAWIIISINNNRVLQVELCWNGAHIIPYFKFQLSPSAERALLPLPTPPCHNPLPLSLSLWLQPFDCQLQHCVCSHGTTVRWLRGTLLIFYVTYLTFDFLEIYINILFYGIQLVRKGTQVHGPLMKCAAKDCAVLAALGKSLLAQARLDKVVDSSIRENRFKLKTSLCFAF